MNEISNCSSIFSVVIIAVNKKDFLFPTIYSQIALIKLSGLVIKPDLRFSSDPATLKYLKVKIFKEFSL